MEPINSVIETKAGIFYLNLLAPTNSNMKLKVEFHFKLPIILHEVVIRALDNKLDKYIKLECIMLLEKSLKVIKEEIKNS